MTTHTKEPNFAFLDFHECGRGRAALSWNGFNAVISSCKPTGPLDEALTRASKAVEPAIALRGECTSRLRDDSDHAQFLVEGLPAIAVSDSALFDGYPCYHKPCDTAEKVNIAYLRSMSRLVATASALLAAAEPGQAAS